MSSALEITPPGPASNAATSSSNQKGMRRPLGVHDWDSLPDECASDGQRVVDDILKGLKRRSVTKSGYDMPLYFAMMCAPSMYIYPRVWESVYAQVVEQRGQHNPDLIVVRPFLAQFVCCAEMSHAPHYVLNRVSRLVGEIMPRIRTSARYRAIYTFETCIPWKASYVPEDVSNAGGTGSPNVVEQPLVREN